jgi:hypothetical protein
MEMDISVRGSRSSAQDWARAQLVPLSELPLLNEEEKAVARKMNLSDEDYARSAFAGQLSEQELLQRTLGFGKWLGARVEERSPDSHVIAVQLDTWEEKFRIRISSGKQSVVFAVDEELVERFLTTGSPELEKSLLRCLTFMFRGNGWQRRREAGRKTDDVLPQRGWQGFLPADRRRAANEYGYSGSGRD